MFLCCLSKSNFLIDVKTSDRSTVGSSTYKPYLPFCWLINALTRQPRLHAMILILTSKIRYGLPGRQIKNITILSNCRKIVRITIGFFTNTISDRCTIQPFYDLVPVPAPFMCWQ